MAISEKELNQSETVINLPKKELTPAEIIQREAEKDLVFMFTKLSFAHRKIMQEVISDEYKELIPSELVKRHNYDEIERYASNHLTPLQATLCYIKNGLERGYASRKGNFTFEDEIGYNIPYYPCAGMTNPR